MKEKIDHILDLIAYGILLTLGLSGFFQIFVVGWLTLFGIQFHWLQYLASVAVFGLGTFSLWLWAKLSPAEE